MLRSLAMAAKKTSKKPSKSDFIRQQPAEMSVADVIAAGKAAGLKFTSSLVYSLRSPKSASTKKGVAKKPAPKKGAAKNVKVVTKRSTLPKKTTTPKKTSTVNKAEFVRANSDLSPRAIVEKAKAEGVELSVTYVYNVRGGDKTAAKKKTAKKGTASKQPTPSSTATKTRAVTKPTASNGSRPSGSVEDLLRAAASELGLGRAIEILEGERARVRAVLGG